MVRFDELFKVVANERPDHSADVRDELSLIQLDSNRVSSQLISSIRNESNQTKHRKKCERNEA